MLGHLRNIALLLCAQRSSRHNNCRIGGLMFDNQQLEIQLQTVFYRRLSKQSITSVQAPILGKKILLVDECDNHVLFHVASQIWQLLQHVMGSQARPIEGRELWYFLFGGGGKKKKALFYNVFSGVIFYPHVLKTIPVPVCLLVLMIWHSCYRAQIFEVCGPKIYICLYVHFMPVSSKRATERVRKLAIPMNFCQLKSQSLLSIGDS